MHSGGREALDAPNQTEGLLSSLYSQFPNQKMGIHSHSARGVPSPNITPKNTQVGNERSTDQSEKRNPMESKAFQKAGSTEVHELDEKRISREHKFSGVKEQASNSPRQQSPLPNTGGRDSEDIYLEDFVFVGFVRFLYKEGFGYCQDLVQGTFVCCKQDPVQGTTVCCKQDPVQGTTVCCEQDLVQGTTVCCEQDLVQGTTVCCEQDLVQGTTVCCEQDLVQGTTVCCEQDLVQGTFVCCEQDPEYAVFEGKGSDLAYAGCVKSCARCMTSLGLGL